MGQISLKGRDPAEILTDIYIALMLGVFLLFPGFGGYMTTTEDKFRLLCWLTGGYMLISLLLPLELKLVGGRGSGSPAALLKGSAWAQRLIFLYLIWTALSAALSIDPLRSLWGGPRREGLLTALMYCGAFLFVSFAGKPKKWHLWLFGVSISLCSIVALIQLAGYNPLGLYPEGMNYHDAFVLYSGQFLGTVGNVDMLASVLCIAIPVFWVAILRMKGRGRFFLIIPLALSLAVLLGSRVEAGIVGVFGGAILTVPVIAPLSPKRRKTLGICAGAFILLALIAVYFLGDRMPGFLREASELLHGRADDSFGSGRIYIWRSVLPLIPERPIFGGGPETLALRSEIVFQRYHQQLGAVLQSYADAAHNEYLNIAADHGIPALVLYLGALIFAAVYWVKTSPDSAAAAICGAGALGYCVQAFFGISSIVSTPFFWLTLALLISGAVKKNSPPFEDKNRRKHK